MRERTLTRKQTHFSTTNDGKQKKKGNFKENVCRRVQGRVGFGIEGAKLLLSCHMVPNSCPILWFIRPGRGGTWEACGKQGQHKIGFGLVVYASDERNLL